MFWRWRRNRGERSQEIVSRLNAVIRAKQRRWADWMQAKTARLSKRTFAVLFALFCLGFGMACSYIIYEAVTVKAWVKRVEQMRMPLVIPQDSISTIHQLK